MIAALGLKALAWLTGSKHGATIVAAAIAGMLLLGALATAAVFYGLWKREQAQGAAAAQRIAERDAASWRQVAELQAADLQRSHAIIERRDVALRALAAGSKETVREIWRTEPSSSCDSAPVDLYLERMRRRTAPAGAGGAGRPPP